MAGVINKTSRQLDLNVSIVGKGGVRRVVTKTLNPGFNVVDNQVWEAAQNNKVVKMWMAGGAIVGNAKQSREEELIEVKLNDELTEDLHDMERTNRVASVVDGDAGSIDTTAVAVGAAADGSDVVETGSSPSDDLLG